MKANKSNAVQVFRVNGSTTLFSVKEKYGKGKK